MERRIVAQMLTCMDTLQSRWRKANTHNNDDDDNEGAESKEAASGGGARSLVLVIGATNRPDALDPALRRAGYLLACLLVFVFFFLLMF